MMGASTYPVEIPATLKEALQLMRSATPRSAVLAGGTDLMVPHDGQEQPDRVICIRQLAELRGGRLEDGGIRIGSLTTCAELIVEDRIRLHAPLLAEAAAQLGGRQIQNMATLGGNLATASPAADLTPALLALDARVRLAAADGTRDMPLDEFVCGYRETALRPCELIESIWIPPRPPGERFAFRKVGARRTQFISKVVVALTATTDGDVVTGLRAAAGAVAPTTIRLPTLTQRLQGQEILPERILEATRECARADCAPIDDVRASARYRRFALQRILASMLTTVLEPSRD